MKKLFLLFALALVISCTDNNIADLGSGFQINEFHAPWDGLTNSTRFTCHSSSDKFFFNFEVVDSTLTLTEPFTGERDVEPEDRVELFFSPDAKLKNYYCAEIDYVGRVLDYQASYYRKFDFDWDFSTLQLWTSMTDFGYRVMGSIDLEELNALGIDTAGGFYLGVFQDDFKPDGSVHWYSLIPTDDAEPDFHKPDVFFRCRLTPKTERRGVVIYPSDVISVGLQEWERRFELSGINLVGIHAATVNEPLDELEAFVKSGLGQEFLALCGKKGVDVEYEIHALQMLLPRNKFEEHPEWFREDAEGVRQMQYNMCFTCADAVEAMRPQIESLLSWMHPTTHRYLIWPDDVTGMFCNCENCRDYSPSEQSLIYENNLLKLLREYDPEATVAHLAYNQTLAAPEKVRASEGIFLEFAPIKRDYSVPLDPDIAEALRKNVQAFPTFSQHILEYWLDESMFCGWNRDALVPLPFHKEECVRDVKGYRDNGASSVTCFATWLGGSYMEQFGSTDVIFREYGEAFE